MLHLPPQGLNVHAVSPQTGDSSGPASKQLLYITLNDSILQQIQESKGKNISITFGPNACLKVGDQLHKFSGVVPEAAPFEIYRQKQNGNSSGNEKLSLVGRVSHKIQIRRGLDTSSMERIKNRTEEAERERQSRKAVFLEKPPPAKKVTAHARHNSGSTRTYLSAFDNFPRSNSTSNTGVRSLPSSPLLRPTNTSAHAGGSNTPKYLPISSPRIHPTSSPHPSSPKPTSFPLRARLAHILALGTATEQTLQDKTRAVQSELTTALQEIAKKVTVGSNLWELKDETYRDLKPKEWRNYTSKEREMVEKKQIEVLARLPPLPSAAASVPTAPEMKKRSQSDAGDQPRLSVKANEMVKLATKSASASNGLGVKRAAEEEIVNPVKKVGGAIITNKKKTAAKVTSSTTTASTNPSTSKSGGVKESAKSTGVTTKSVPAKRAKENPKIKSAEKIIDSDSASDSDIPLQKRVKNPSTSTTIKSLPATDRKSGLKGLGISTPSAAETKPPVPSQVASPPISRSRTSSSSSGNPYSPPKKRSPLATNEPITARAPSPQPAKKRPLEQQKEKDDVAPVPKKQKKEIGQEYHDLAARFRKLYPEYQELHRKLQGLSTDRLARERNNVERLVKMQEQLEKWKATLWKVAGDGENRIGVKV